MNLFEMWITPALSQMQLLNKMEYADSESKCNDFKWNVPASTSTLHLPHMHMKCDDSWANETITCESRLLWTNCN